MKKFDVIVGNPPFQETEDSGARKQKSHNLYSKFIVKGYNILSDDGYLAMVCPASWMTPYGNTAGKSSKEGFKRLFRRNRLLYLNLNDIEGFNVGSTFTAFVMQKNTDNKAQTFIKGIYNKNRYQSRLKITPDHIWLPNLLTKESVSILEKTNFSALRKFDVKNDNFFHPVVVSSSKGKKILHSKASKDCIYEQYHTNTKSKWSNIPHLNQNQKKVLFTKSGYFKPCYDNGQKGVTEAAFYILVDSNKEGQNLIDILNGKLYRFIVSTSKWSGFNMPEVVQTLPWLDTQKTWTDRDIYNYFELTQDEIDLIEDTLK